jgi:hypothetical protein
MTCRSVLVLCVLAALLAAAGAVTSAVRAEPPSFSVVAPGIAHAAFRVRPSDAEPFSGHAFKIDLDVAELRLIPAGDPPLRRTVEQIVAPYPVVVAANASFFDTDGRAMGLAVDQGRVTATSNRRPWGALVIDGTQGRIVLGADIQNPLDHRLIVQGIPRLVVGGQVQPLKPQVAERTAVCAFARFLADPPDRGGLGCRDALNLDGGPSTQLVVKLPTLALSLPGGWGVPNALVVAPGKR